jgi:hypothetical protein
MELHGVHVPSIAWSSIEPPGKIPEAPPYSMKNGTAPMTAQAPAITAP